MKYIGKYRFTKIQIIKLQVNEFRNKFWNRGGDNKLKENWKTV